MVHCSKCMQNVFLDRFPRYFVTEVLNPPLPHPPVARNPNNLFTTSRLNSLLYHRKLIPKDARRVLDSIKSDTVSINLRGIVYELFPGGDKTVWKTGQDITQQLNLFLKNPPMSHYLERLRSLPGNEVSSGEFLIGTTSVLTQTFDDYEFSVYSGFRDPDEAYGNKGRVFVQVSALSYSRNKAGKHNYILNPIPVLELKVEGRLLD